MSLLTRNPALAGMALSAANLAKSAALDNYGLFLRLSAAPSDLSEELSPFAALRAAEHARRRVPAYRDFLAERAWRDDPRLPVPDRLRLLPVMDKESYVKRFSTEDRCLDGRLPMVGTTVDESSGSSGTPYNWVRSTAELHGVHRELGQFARYCFGANVITINGFSMGSWATGVNTGEAMRAIGVVKSTGPDSDKILHTLEFFGPAYRYIITGYPPFLKHLLDLGEARGFDWAAYRMDAIVGGEGMSEGLRAYLERRFRRVISGYGASDIDIGVAGELPLSVWIRKHASDSPKLRAALFGDDPRLPMLFHYNPLDYYVETNAERELILTVNRLAVLSPRIRYNIHDTGGVISFNRMLAVLRDFGLDPLADGPRRGLPHVRLPFLYLFGRSDSTFSYMGANIYPEDVEQALFTDAADAARLGAYCLELVEIGRGEQRSCVHVEVLPTPMDDDGALAGRLRERVVDRLLANSRDFREAVREDPTAGDILVRLHAADAGPFAANSGRIKRRYILNGTATTASHLSEAVPAVSSSAPPAFSSKGEG